MAKEREIKLRFEDLPALRRALAKLGARVVKLRVHERNVIFDTPNSTLAKKEQVLQIRTEGPVGTAGSSRKGERHKVREELELEVSDGKALARIFEGLGMRGWFQYEKFRTTFRLPSSRRWAKGLLLELDETPIGVFLELEGPASAIDRAARALGFEKRDYVVANYLDLYREFCQSRGEEPRDMLFTKRTRR